MKIAFVSPFPPSKVTLNEYGYHLIRSFINKPGVDEIVVLTNHIEKDQDYGRYATPGIELIPCWNFDSLMTPWNLAKELKKQKPDVIIYNLQFMTFGEGKVPAAMGLLTPWISKILRIPSIVLLHNIIETVNLESIGMTENKLMQQIYMTIGRQLTKLILKADIVGLTIAQYVDIINEAYKTNKAVLLPHGNFELPERSYLPENLTEINLMAFGKFGTYKKVEVMLESLEILIKRYPELKFSATVAGTDNPNVKGYLDAVKTKYQHLPNVHFTGYVAEEDVELLFKKSTFVIFPYSTTTGSSGIIHQAGSYARACVLPMIDDLKRVVEEEGYDGAFFEVENAQSMADAVGSLLENPMRRKAIEDKNFAAAKGLPMSQLADMYLYHINQLLNRTIHRHDGTAESLAVNQS